MGGFSPSRHGKPAELKAMSERPDEQMDTSPAQRPTQQKAGPSMGVKEKTAPKHPRLDRLPSFHILLHNDDVNDMGYVVDTICDLTPLSPHRAATVMLEAHKSGLSLMLTTHQERAELYVEQFTGKGLTVTMEVAP
jgi:ATP-dependent Clp protease adaptor protein ClpS